MLLLSWIKLTFAIESGWPVRMEAAISRNACLHASTDLFMSIAISLHLSWDSSVRGYFLSTSWNFTICAPSHGIVLSSTSSWNREKSPTAAFFGECVSSSNAYRICLNRSQQLCAEWPPTLRAMSSQKWTMSFLLADWGFRVCRSATSSALWLFADHAMWLKTNSTRSIV